MTYPKGAMAGHFQASSNFCCLPGSDNFCLIILIRTFTGAIAFDVPDINFIHGEISGVFQ